MTETHDHLVEQQAQAPAEQEEGGAATLYTVGLFLVMVVFTIGCMFFGWFQ